MNSIKKLALVLILLVIPIKADFRTTVVPHFTPGKLMGFAGLYVTVEALIDYYRSNFTKVDNANSQESLQKSLGACFFDAIFDNKRTWAVAAGLLACGLCKAYYDIPTVPRRMGFPLNQDGVEYNLMFPPDHSTIKKELYELVPYEIWEDFDYRKDTSVVGTIKECYGDIFAPDAEQKLLHSLNEAKKTWEKSERSFYYHVITQTNIFYAERKKHLLLNFFKLLQFSQNPEADKDALAKTLDARILAEFNERMKEACKKMAERYKS